MKQKCHKRKTSEYTGVVQRQNCGLLIRRMSVRVASPVPSGIAQWQSSRLLTVRLCVRIALPEPHGNVVQRQNRRLLIVEMTGFESLRSHHKYMLAQLNWESIWFTPRRLGVQVPLSVPFCIAQQELEHRSSKPGVVGSSPTAEASPLGQME